MSKNKKIDWTWAERVANLLKKNNISQRAFASAIGVSHMTVFRWLGDNPNGRGPTEEQKKIMCKLLLTPYETLFHGLKTYASLRYVPVVDFSSVKSIQTIHEQIDNMQLADQVISCPVPTSNMSFAVKINNDAFFAPFHDVSAIIPAGSVMFFDSGVPLVPGNPSVFALENSLRIRVWQQMDEQHWLTVLNPKYSEITKVIDAPEKFYIASLVTWLSFPQLSSVL